MFYFTTTLFFILQAVHKISDILIFHGLVKREKLSDFVPVHLFTSCYYSFTKKKEVTISSVIEKKKSLMVKKKIGNLLMCKGMIYFTYTCMQYKTSLTIKSK